MAKAKKSETSLTLEGKLEQALIADDEQPYKVPDNWCWVYLNKGFAYCLDNFRKPVNAAERSTMQGDIPYYGATGQVGWINDFLTDEHLVLVGEDGAPFLDYAKDKAYIIDGKAWVNNHAHILRSFYGKESNVYLMHYLNIFDYHGYVNGSTRLKLTQSSMNSIPVPLPPVKEQKRIVDHIETFFSKLDEVKENAQNVIDGFENRKSAILHKAFNGELTAKWREENNRNIAEWKNKKLGEYAFVTKLAGFEYTKNIAPNLVNNGVPLFKGKNVQEGTLILKFESFIPKSVSDELPRSKLTKKCLLTPYVDTIGNIALFDGSFEAHLGSNVGKIEIEKETFEEYLLYYLRSDFGYKELTKQKKATAQESISIQAIRDVITILPSLEEQHEIVRILDSTLSKEQQAKEKAEEVLERIELIKKSILARAFRGELGTNNPDEESSLELLKMVLSEDKDEKTISKPESK